MTRVGANQQSPICMDYHKLHCLSGEKLRLWAAGQGRKRGWGPRRGVVKYIKLSFLWSWSWFIFHTLCVLLPSYSWWGTSLPSIEPALRPGEQRTRISWTFMTRAPPYTHILPCLLRVLIFLREGDYNELPRQSERSHLMESYNNNCWHKLWRLHQNVTTLGGSEGRNCHVGGGIVFLRYWTVLTVLREGGISSAFW